MRQTWWIPISLLFSLFATGPVLGQGRSIPEPSGLVWTLNVTTRPLMKMIPTDNFGFYVLWNGSVSARGDTLLLEHFDTGGAALDQNPVQWTGPLDQPQLWDACADLQGGFFLATIQGSRVIIEHVDSHLKSQWKQAVSDSAARSTELILTEDETGGFYMAWLEEGSIQSTFWVQRWNAAGQPLWAKPIRPGKDAGPNQLNMVRDGTGGIIVEWKSWRQENAHDRAQRITADGRMLWDPVGVDIHPVVGDLRQRLPLAAPGMGGVVAAWTQGSEGLNRIFYQHINPEGLRDWPLTGVTVNPPTDEQWNPVILGSGKNNLWVGWEEVPSDGPQKVMIVRRDPPKGDPWPPGILGIATTPGGQGRLTMELDGAGGIMVAWLDNRTDTGIYLQDIDSQGTLRYGDGIQVAGGLGRAQRPHILLLANQRVAVAWAEDLGDNRWYLKRRVLDLPK